ncbi:hypothetical protein CTI12_AA434860 [Artemisia annua]|uniref:Uncharacterized protein n=1 Tax=Artemisia annua TaxID=35608 RepID=A0A2U1LXT5_ARTAN|nr:hypothetical protein CTI12_AA434860 [Artemisia annua]
MAIQEDVEQKQMHDTMLLKYRGSCLRSLSALEEQGRRFFTPFESKSFKRSSEKQFNIRLRKKNKPSLKHHRGSRLHKDCFEISSTYWSPRWCRKEVEL